MFRMSVNQIQACDKFGDLHDHIKNLVPTASEKVVWFTAELVDVSDRFLFAPVRQLRWPAPKHRQTTKEIKQMENSFSLQQDKGLSFVVIKRKEFINKILGIVRRLQPDSIPEYHLLPYK